MLAWVKLLGHLMLTRALKAGPGALQPPHLRGRWREVRVPTRSYDTWPTYNRTLEVRFYLPDLVSLAVVQLVKWGLWGQEDALALLL